MIHVKLLITCDDTVYTHVHMLELTIYTKDTV